MSYDYSENMLIQKSAAGLLRDELGWETVYAYTDSRKNSVNSQEKNRN